jgi:hypothetical protein
MREQMQAVDVKQKKLKHRGHRGTQGKATEEFSRQVDRGRFQAAEIAERCYCYGFGFEKFMGQQLQIVGGDGFDLLDEFVEILEVLCGRNPFTERPEGDWRFSGCN